MQSLLSFLQPAAPEIFMAIAAMVLLLLGVFAEKISSSVLTWLALAVMIVAGALVLHTVPATAFSNLFLVNPFTTFAKLLMLLGAGLTSLMINTWAQREGTARNELPVLVLFATIGMMMMISANDLISLYVGLEMQSLSLYVLAAYNRDNMRATEAGVKYFILGALASGLLLYGSSLAYGFGGTTTFDGLALAVKDGTHSIGLMVGIVFIIAGLAFKVAAVPFHMWTPDVYEGAPTPVTAFFSVAPKAAAVGLLVRVMMGPFGPIIGEWQQIVIFISVASMILGAVAAINQTNIKRLMAYSSIGHIGYILIGLATGTEAGIRAIAVYLAIYLVMSVGTFGVILAMRAKGVAVEGIDDLKGLARTRPGLALAMAIFMFSMAGIPPLAGFLGKLYVFLAAVEAHLFVLAVIGVLASVVAAYYYLRIVKIMYFDEPTGELDKSPGYEVSLIVAASALFVGFFFIWPQPVLAAAARAAHALFGN